MNVAIITYPFESGLFYLAKSFEYEFREKYNFFYIPKRKFTLINNRWIPNTKNENNLFLHIDDNNEYAFEILLLCKKFNIEKIFSFETFIRDSSWVDLLSINGIKVIDIPMIEWVLKKDFDLNKYKKFYKIYCTTNYTFNIFSKKYSNAIKFFWDYCPDITFKNNKCNKLTFYHPGSIQEINWKNTDIILDSITSIDNYNFNFMYSGFSNKKINDDRVVFIGHKKNRQDIIDAYNIASCIIAPSSREGLGLSFYEAKKTKCDIITTNAPIMDEHTKYLCESFKNEKSETLMPFYKISKEDLTKVILKYCEDFYGRK